MRAWLLLVVFLPTAAAFLPVPPGDSVHDQITAEAAEAVAWPEDGVAALQEAVRRPDMEDMEWEPEEPTQIGVHPDYRPERHCDRVPPATDQEAFLATAAHVQALLEEARQAVQANRSEDAVAALGEALHAGQDCYSHSNHVDLHAQDQEAFTEALVGRGDAPPGLRLTAFDPDAEDPGSPDDPYPHDRFAKDHHDHNPESRAPLGTATKFDAAQQAAVAFSALVLEAFLDGLEEEQVRALGEVRSPEPADRIPMGPLALVAVAAVLLLRRR